MSEYFLPLARWTIGPVAEAGFDCLERSINSFKAIYKVQAVICHNGLSEAQLDRIKNLGVRLWDQEQSSDAYSIPPVGVAWKLYPKRLAHTRHEICIDNDLIIEKPIQEITNFFQNKHHTLLLEGETRNYGAFERHVPPGYNINSGIFGMPPHFYTHEFDREWEENCGTSSKTWDEQGFVAYNLLRAPHFIIPKTTVVNCEYSWCRASGYHFVGLNRTSIHRPYIEFKTSKLPLYL